jgi:hypothetical protein
MRLTLRTLLAYLDDILDPADARELGKKIEDSEFASELVHRIRSVTRKLRLGAPKLSGKGMGLDANTVAEYLDNTLPQDRVPDFEKVCLESDVQLAEVAACHQILTLVLGEPADVDPALRERMRSLHTDLADAPREERGSAISQVTPSVPIPVFDDRRGTEWNPDAETPVVAAAATKRPANAGRPVRLLPILGTLVVAFLLALVALIAIGPLNYRHPILGRFFPEPSSPEGRSGGVPVASAPVEPARPAAGGDRQADQPQPVPRTQTGDKIASASPSGPAVDESAGAGKAGPVAPPDEPTEALPVAPPDTVAPPPADADATPEVTQPDAAPRTAMNDPALTRAKLPPDEEEAKEPAPETPEPLALYASDQHVLTHYDAEKRTWLRVATNDPLGPATRLVALPTFRPQVLFSSGVQMTLVGPAEVQLTEPDPEGVPGVIVQYGRLLVMPGTAPNSRLNIQVGARQSRVTFDNLDGTLVLDVWRYLPPGTDPQTRAANWVLEAFTVAGRLTWQDQGAAAPAAVEPNQLVTMVDTGAPSVRPLPQLPEWLDIGNETLINQAASKQLEPLLDSAQPVEVSLRDQVNNRLVEVRTLAIRSLSQFDEFDPCIAALSSRESRYFWKDIADSLRAAECRSPETARQVHAALGRLRGDEGAVLDRFLWGFSPEQLGTGGAQQLVDALSSPSIDVRVLAYLNLSAITGKTNNFQPDREPRSQRRPIMNWERDLEQHTVVYKSPPVEPAGVGAPPKEGDEAGGPPNVP